MSRNAKQRQNQPLTPFAERLSELMDARGVSQAQVGKAIGAQRQTVSLYKLGQSKPDIESLAKLAQFFGVTSDYLIGLSDVQCPDIDTRAIADKTGLSEGALEFLAREKASFEDMDFPKGYISSSLNITRILTHPAFSEVLHCIDNAQAYSWLAAKRKELHALMGKERLYKIHGITDSQELGIEEEAWLTGSAVIDGEDAVALEEYNAAKHMNQIISWLCLEKNPIPWINDYINESKGGAYDAPKE